MSASPGIHIVVGVGNRGLAQEKVGGSYTVAGRWSCSRRQREKAEDRVIDKGSCRTTKTFPLTQSWLYRYPRVLQVRRGRHYEQVLSLRPPGLRAMINANQYILASMSLFLKNN